MPYPPLIYSTDASVSITERPLCVTPTLDGSNITPVVTSIAEAPVQAGLATVVNARLGKATTPVVSTNPAGSSIV